MAHLKNKKLRTGQRFWKANFYLQTTYVNKFFHIANQIIDALKTNSKLKMQQS